MPPLEVRGIEAVWTHIMTRRPRKEGGQSPRSRQSNMDMSQNREGPKKYPVPFGFPWDHIQNRQPQKGHTDASDAPGGRHAMEPRSKPLIEFRGLNRVPSLHLAVG